MDPDIIHEEIEKCVCLIYYYGKLIILTVALSLFFFFLLVYRVMPIHEILLESTDMAVRVAAGENTALLFELLRIHTGHVRLLSFSFPHVKSNPCT